MFSLSTIIKGFIVGATMMVPGVSGGSMAMVLGAYDKLIASLGNLFKDFKNNVIYLCQFGIAGLLGIVLCANPISRIIERFPIVSMFFFFGLVFGSVPMLYKKAEIKEFKVSYVIWFIIGIAIVVSMDYLPTFGSAGDDLTFSMIILQLITGVVVAIGFILPGISTSYLLLLLGTYEFVMNAIATHDFIALIPLLIGFAAGVLLLTKVLDMFMKKYPTQTYILILGFLLGSIYPVFPGVPQGLDILWSIIAFAVGTVIIYFISKKEAELEAASEGNN